MKTVFRRLVSPQFQLAGKALDINRLKKSIAVMLMNRKGRLYHNPGERICLYVFRMHGNSIAQILPPALRRESILPSRVSAGAEADIRAAHFAAFAFRQNREGGAE